MPTINNATVATGTGLSTAGNGGRKLVRLLNGALISAVRTSTTSWQLHKSLNGGSTWSQLVTITEAVNDLTLATKGNDIHVTVSFSTSGVKHYRYNDSGVLQGTAQNVDTGQMAMGNVSLAINDAGTELHAAWSSKNGTYPNSFNIRYAKGTIAADGSVTWGTVEQRTTVNQVGYDNQKPSVTLKKDGYPVIVWETTLASQNGIYGQQFNGPSWAGFVIFNGASYIQSTPSTLFIPQSINGFANGRLWVAWHGKDATDNAKFNIRSSYSDDGGVTWSTPIKQTTGNLYDQMNASLTADKNGKVLLYWDGDEDASGNTVTVTKEKNYTGTWGTTTSISGDNHYGVSTFFDRTFSLSMARAPLVRYYVSGVRFTGNYFAPASVSPLSSALGSKETPSVLSYTVTPDPGSTITSIVEKVNGTTVNTYSNPASLSRAFTIPLANWDALKYYNTHTISVTVTDSNGMANTQTYTFNKALANDASLLEGTKAAKDGKDRISTKRDVLAGQVGLPAGSTFDAISAQLDAGQAVVKRQVGVITSSATQLSSSFYVTIPISSIGFIPKSLDITLSSSGSPLASINTDSASSSSPQIMQSGNSNQSLDGTTWYINSTSVRLPVGASYGNTAMKWIAYG